MRQREQKIDQDFSKLMERYNKSKQLIDSLYGSQGSFVAPEQDRPKKNSKDERQLQPIQTDFVEKDKYKNLKQLNKELKSTLKEYVNRDERKPSDSENSALINQYEKELQEAQNGLINAMHDLKEYSIREDQYRREFEIVQQENETLRTKILKKKSKIQHLKEFKHRDNYQLEEQTMIFNKELQRVQLLCEDFSLEIKDVEQKNLHLKEENDLLKEEIRQADKKTKILEQNVFEFRQKEQQLLNQFDGDKEEIRLLQNKIDALERKNEETKDILGAQEHKISKIKEKHDQEKIQIMQQCEDKISNKKNKIKQQRAQISDLEIRYLNHEKDLAKYKKIVDDCDAEIIRLKQLLAQSKQEQENLLRDLNVQIEKQKHFESDHEILKKQFYQTEEKLRYEMDYKLKEQKHNQKIHDEVDDLSQENHRLKTIIYDLEQQIDLIKRDQNEEMSQIESKVDGLVREIQLLREENNDIKTKCVETKRTSQQFEEKYNETRAKYIKIKQHSKVQEQQMKNIEDKMKQYENERYLESIESQKSKQHQSQAQESKSTKVKVLDEIQNMIRQHRKLIHE